MDISKFFPNLQTSKSETITKEEAPVVTAPTTTGGIPSNLSRFFNSSTSVNAPPSNIITPSSLDLLRKLSGKDFNEDAGDISVANNKLLASSANVDDPSFSSVEFFTSTNSIFNSYSSSKKEKRPSISVEMIAKYVSTKPPNSGQLITTTDKFICYAVKHGIVRILNKFDPLRSLLRGHTKDLTDLRVASHTEDLLLTCSLDGSAIVWLISTAQILLKLQSFGTSHFHKGAFSPMNNEKIVLLQDNHAILIDRSKVNESSEDIVSLPDFASTSFPGVIVCKTGSNGILTDFAFSSDGLLLLTSSQDGYVTVFHGVTGILLHAFQVTEKENGISSVNLIKSSGSVFVLTGEDNNKILKLWPPINKRSSEYLDSLTIVGDDLNLEIAFCEDYIYLGDVKTPRLFMACLTTINSSPQFSSMVELESLSTPILSMTPEFESAKGSVNLYCIQSEAIQRYVVNPLSILPPFSPSSSSSFIVPSPKVNASLSSSPSMAFVPPSKSSTPRPKTASPPPTKSPTTVKMSEYVASPKSPVKDTTSPISFSPMSSSPMSSSPSRTYGKVADITNPSSTASSLASSPLRKTVEEKKMTTSSPPRTSVPIHVESPVRQSINENINNSNKEKEKEEEEEEEKEDEVIDSLVEEKKEKVKIDVKEVESKTKVVNSVASISEESIHVFLIALAKQQQGMMNQLDKKIESHVDNLFSAHMKDFEARLKQENDAREAAYNKKMQSLLSVVSKSMYESLPQTIEDVVSQVVNEAFQSQSPAKTISPESASILVSKLINDESMKALHKPVLDAFKECFLNSLVPKFEKAIGTMFNQIDNSVHKNVGEKIDKAIVKFTNAEGILISILKESIETTRESISKSNEIIEKSSEVLERNNHLVDALNAHKTRWRGSEDNVEREDQIGKYRGRIEAQVEGGNYNDALEIALTVSDTDVLAWTCDLIDSKNISFNSLGLSQPIILCIMQQLSTDLKRNSSLKLSWMRDASLALNIRDPIVSSHCPAVLKNVQNMLLSQSSLFSDPSDSNSNNFRLLVHVVNSITTQL